MSASKIVRSRVDRYCNNCGRFHIKAGDLYERVTVFPGDELFSWVDRDTLKPWGKPVVLTACREQEEAND